VVILGLSGLESLAFGRPGIVGAEGRSAPDRRRSNLASDLWVRRRSTLERAHDRDSSTILGGFRLRASRPHPASADVDIDIGIGVLTTA